MVALRAWEGSIDTADYKVPKHTVRATLRQQGLPARDVELFLAERSAGRAGPERPSDLLEGKEPFVPAKDGDDGVVLLHKHTILALSVDAEAQLAPDAWAAEDLAGERATTHDVEVVLVDGTRLRGTVAYLLPEGRQRVRDYLDQAGAAIVLRDGERVHVVATAHVAKVRIHEDT